MPASDSPAPARPAPHRAALPASARGLAVTLAAVLAAAVGLFTLPTAAWAALGASTGVLLAAALRWGRATVMAGPLAVGAVAMVAGQPPAMALAGTVAQALALALVGGLLGGRAPRGRPGRASDLLRGGAVLAGLAAPAGVLGGCAVLLAAGAAPLQDLPVLAFAGWSTLTLGGLGLAFPLLALHRSDWAEALRPRPRNAARLLLALLLLLSAAALGWPGVAGSAWSAPLLLAGPLLAVALATAAGAPAAALASVLAVMLAGGNRWAIDGASAFVFAAWAAALLLPLLLVHARELESRWAAQRWEWALDGSRLGVADWHLRRGQGFASAGWRALTGHEAPAWTPEAWLDGAHPEDQDALATAIAAVADGHDGRRRLELRLRHGTAWRWFEATLLVIERDAQGRPARLLATLSDVEERHEAIERQRLSASLFQHLHEGLLVTDADLRVLDVNPAYGQILGVTRQELLGQVPSLLRPTPVDPLARQQRAAMWASLRDTGSWRGELLERRRSGEACTLQATISSVLGPQGDLRYHVLVISDITEQRAQRERLERQAHFDELTRLPNRAHLALLLADAMRAADRDGFLLVVCYLDLDRFKPVNDRFGHAAGDRLLAELAGRLRSALRRRDTWADVAARLGGDEFVLLLRSGTVEEGRLAVERVLRVVSQPYVIDPAAEPVQVTASMGATVYPIDRSDADTLLRHADHAMYGAKQSGRNGYLFFDPEHRRRTEERVMAIGRVQEALDRGEFVLFYQPKVDMRTDRVLGFEALLRWEHPQQGMIAPQQFLPLIEDTGLSARVGDWVFSQALEHLAAWRRAGLDITVGVNVSARHLQERDFAQRLAELLARHPEPLAAHVELEMVETAAFADIGATSALMARCRELGVRFALDDFGTGYSPLTYLKQLPADTLKIDRSFVHNMLSDPQDRALVEGVISLARTFGCRVVAEGVESPAQARTLLELGCDIGQGTGIAAPMPASQVAGWVRGWRGMFAIAPAAPTADDDGANPFARLGG